MLLLWLPISDWHNYTGYTSHVDSYQNVRSYNGPFTVGTSIAPEATAYCWWDVAQEKGEEEWDVPWPEDLAELTSDYFDFPLVFSSPTSYGAGHWVLKVTFDNKSHSESFRDRSGEHSGTASRLRVS